MSMRHFIRSARIKPVVRTAARLIGSWHIPMVLLIAAVCLIAGVTLPVVVVREFFLYRQELSVIDGVHALFDAGDWLVGDGPRAVLDHPSDGEDPRPAGAVVAITRSAAASRAADESAGSVRSLGNAGRICRRVGNRADEGERLHRRSSRSRAMRCARWGAGFLRLKLGNLALAPMHAAVSAFPGRGAGSACTSKASAISSPP